MRSDVSDVSSSWYDFWGWAETNRKNLAFGGIGILALVFGVIIYRWNASQTEVAASGALLQLRASPPAGRPEPAATAEDYLKVAKAYPKTAAAERALLLAAGAAFTEGKYAEAQAQFQSFVKEHTDRPFAATAAYGAATSLEAQGKPEEALAAYQNIEMRYPKSALVGEAKLAVARLYEAKDQPEQALKTYDEIAKTGTMSSAGGQAMMRKQYLLSMYPGLGKTNPPSATMTNSPAASVPVLNLPSTATNVAGAKP